MNFEDEDTGISAVKEILESLKNLKRYQNGKTFVESPRGSTAREQKMSGLKNGSTPKDNSHPLSMPNLPQNRGQSFANKKTPRATNIISMRSGFSRATISNSYKKEADLSCYFGTPRILFVSGDALNIITPNQYLFHHFIFICQMCKSIIGYS